MSPVEQPPLASIAFLQVLSLVSYVQSTVSLMRQSGVTKWQVAYLTHHATCYAYIGPRQIKVNLDTPLMRLMNSPSSKELATLLGDLWSNTINKLQAYKLQNGGISIDHVKVTDLAKQKKTFRGSCPQRAVIHRRQLLVSSFTLSRRLLLRNFDSRELACGTVLVLKYNTLHANYRELHAVTDFKNK